MLALLGQRPVSAPERRLCYSGLHLLLYLLVRQAHTLSLHEDSVFLLPLSGCGDHLWLVLLTVGIRVVKLAMLAMVESIAAVVPVMHAGHALRVFEIIPSWPRKMSRAGRHLRTPLIPGV